MTGIQKKKLDFLYDLGYEFLYKGETIVKVRRFVGDQIRLATVDDLGRITWTTIKIEQKEYE